LFPYFILPAFILFLSEVVLMNTYFRKLPWDLIIPVI
jgi:hypothetical protein